MVSTPKKTQSSRKLLSQLDDFDRDTIIDNAASERHENIVVNEGSSRSRSWPGGGGGVDDPMY